MAKDDNSRDLMDYEALQQNALRGVIRAALERAAGPRGLPGDHHFYISFRTRWPGLAIPAELAARYPDEMTIVLQNQFWDLKPAQSGFSVTLQFNGQPKSLAIPYAAVTRFYDPSVQYLLQFATPLPPPAAKPTSVPTAKNAPAAAPAVVAERGKPAPGADAPNVVKFDQFRKK
jgi:hypothetical protein